MNLIHYKKELDALLKERRKSSKIVGFVPTMGALHQGHFSLINHAQQQSDLVVVSIFVNPTQFDNPSDLASYPQELNEDLANLETHFDNLIVFAPRANEIYATGIVAETFDFGTVASTMEGASRTGHFNGVGTVLKKFFEIIHPEKAFFGEKDYQQLLIVKKLVQLLNSPIEIIGCPIDREENGLARSSRNKRLSPKAREQATFIHQELIWAQTNFGQLTLQEICKIVIADFEANPAFKLDYFTIAEADSLKTAQITKENKKYRAFIAAEIDNVRLIDNIALN